LDSYGNNGYFNADGWEEFDAYVLSGKTRKEKAVGYLTNFIPYFDPAKMAKDTVAFNEFASPMVE
jgi:hypothetical protein